LIQDAEMVKKEISIMKELDHKNIVRYIDDFRDKGEWYIVLEYCGKGDLDHFKQKVGKIPEQHCKMFIEGILEALVELHKKKIAHRDLKLANILITDDYKLKLADFGFSKDYESGYMKTFCGSPITMAPEILKRETYNEKCDVWSLGVITYMLLYRIPPFLPTKAEGMGI
jgi:serine/threonine-protein kinase ULK/ATG1